MTADSMHMSAGSEPVSTDSKHTAADSKHMDHQWPRRRPSALPHTAYRGGCAPVGASVDVQMHPPRACGVRASRTQST